MLVQNILVLQKGCKKKYELFKAHQSTTVVVQHLITSSTMRFKSFMLQRTKNVLSLSYQLLF